MSRLFESQSPVLMQYPTHVFEGSMSKLSILSPPPPIWSPCPFNLLLGQIKYNALIKPPIQMEVCVCNLMLADDIDLIGGSKYNVRCNGCDHRGCTKGKHLGAWCLRVALLSRKRVERLHIELGRCMFALEGWWVQVNRKKAAYRAYVSK